MNELNNLHKTLRENYVTIGDLKARVDRQLELLIRVDKAIEKMHSLKIVYPADMNDLWDDVVKELSDDRN